MGYKATVREYYLLTKPGIIRGNLLAATAGFFLASPHEVHWLAYLYLVIGMSLVIGAACVYNNYLDRGIDANMERTQQRALVTGAIAGPAALTYASVLGAGGTLLLALKVNLLTAVIGLGGMFAYVVLYGYIKRRSPYGTEVGSISGAIPPVAGYTAATGRLDLAALLLFLILVFWQMPHFFGIALYRAKEYAAAGIPVLPLKKGAENTRRRMLTYTLLFTATAPLLTVFGYAGYTYAAVTGALSLWWLWLGLKGYRTTPTEVWGKRMFLFSLLVLLVWSALTALGPRLP